MTRYHHLQAAAALTLGCAAVAASSSSSAPASGSILRGEGEGEMDDLNNENFKENEDWWKDPFAMFDEDEENTAGGAQADDMELMEELPELTEEEAAPVVNNEDEFLIIEESEPEPEPVQGEPEPEPAEAPAEAASKGWGGWAIRSNNNNNKATAEEDAAPPQHNPLVEQAMVTSQKASLADNPKLQTMWKALPFFNSLLASFAFIKVVQPVIEQATERHQSNIFSKNSQQYYDDIDDDEYSSRSQDHGRRRNNNHNDQELDDDDDDDRSLQQKQQQRPTSPKKEKSFGFGGGMFGGRKPKKYVEKLPPARELMELVEGLQREVDTLKVEKEAVDAEYEKTSWTLQETQNEMANLQSTTQYLKAQLRDNAEIMDRAVRAERRKARDELTKMKEAMLQVLQRERAELRAKMLKQTQEVQAILKEQQQSSKGGGSNNNSSSNSNGELMTTG